jgi:hypothetical protein
MIRVLIIVAAIAIAILSVHLGWFAWWTVG